MAHRRGGLVPIAEALDDLPGPVQALCEPAPQARRGFTLADQVNQLVGASEADPDPGLYGADDGVVLPAPHQPRQPERVQARQRPVHALHERGRWQQAPLRQPASSVAGLGVYRSRSDSKPRVDSGSFALRTRLRNQMKRLFSATVQLIYEDQHGEARVSSFIADRTEFWWNARKPNEPSLWESKIELSEKFFNEIIRHPVPIDMNTLTALKRSSLGLDLYLWLVYRTFPLRTPQRITWRQVYRQFGLHPSNASDKRTVLDFRRKVLRELKKIKLAWPELNYSTAPGLLILHPSTPAIAPLNQGQLNS